MPTRDFRKDQTELIVLGLLAEGPAYGYAISKQVAATSNGELKIGPGQLYPLLSKLEKSKLVSASWEDGAAPAKSDDSESSGRRRKWYKLTAKGKAQLAKHIEAHRRVTAVIERFIEPFAQEASA